MCGKRTSKATESIWMAGRQILKTFLTNEFEGIAATSSVAQEAAHSNIVLL